MARSVFYIFLFSLILVAAITFSGCEETEKYEKYYIGTVSAMRNGVHLTNECVSYENNFNPDIIYLDMLRITNPRGYWEEIVIDNISKIKGKFTVVNALMVDPHPEYGSFCVSRLDDDVVVDMYYLLETEDNYINITKLDEQTNDFTGTFNLTFIREIPYNNYILLPDTLRFTDGVFQAKFTHYPF
ncbi:MAG: hypothetical protein AB9846_01485 [Tenuifilaceae bacterium]